MTLARLLPSMIGLLAAMSSTLLWALPSDRNQPIRIQADTAELDDRNGVAIYVGDVIITQGSMKITGDRVTVTQTNNGGIDTVTSVGRPAYFEQNPAADKNVVKAYGLTIQYFAAKDRVVLLDQARIVQDGNTFSGEKIVYDTQRQIVNAGRANTGNITTPSPRIDMILQPRNKAPEAEAQ